MFLSVSVTTTRMQTVDLLDIKSEDENLNIYFILGKKSIKNVFEHTLNMLASC